MLANVYLIDTKSFKGKKDSNKEYYNIFALGDETSYKFSFVRKEDYDKVINLPKFTEIQIDIDLYVAGSTPQGEPLYGVKLKEVIGVFKSEVKK